MMLDKIKHINEGYFIDADLIMLKSNSVTLVAFTKFNKYEFLFLNEEYPKLPNRDVHEFKHIYLISKIKIENKKDLIKHKYYYVKNHYGEWNIGRFSGKGFIFIDNKGTFVSDLFTAFEVLGSTNKTLKYIDLFTDEFITSNKTYSFPNLSMGLISLVIDRFNDEFKERLENIEIMVEVEPKEQTKTTNNYILKLNNYNELNVNLYEN